MVSNRYRPDAIIIIVIGAIILAVGMSAWFAVTAGAGGS